MVLGRGADRRDRPGRRVDGLARVVLVLLLVASWSALLTLAVALGLLAGVVTGTAAVAVVVATAAGVVALAGRVGAGLPLPSCVLTGGLVVVLAALSAPQLGAAFGEAVVGTAALVALAATSEALLVPGSALRTPGRRAGRPVRAGAEGGGPQPGSDAELAALLVCLPPDLLLEEWERSSAALARRCHGPEAVGLWQLRARLLEEMERRDGAGVQAWLAAAAQRACGPAEFVLREHDPA